MANLKSQIGCKNERFMSYLAVCIGTLVILQFWLFEKKWYIQGSKEKAEWRGIWEENDVFPNATASVEEIRVAAELLNMRKRVRAALLCESSNHSVGSMTAEASCLKNALFFPALHGDEAWYHTASAMSQLETLRRETLALKERVAVLAKGLSEERAVGEERGDRVSVEVVGELKRQSAAMRRKLVACTVFLPLKDSREAGLTETSHNWFMSSVDGQSRDGFPESFDFPADDSLKRVLCLKGNHSFDGTQNFYAFAWKDYLPPNSVFLPGLTFVSDNYWDYDNPWHSMSALIYFISWRSRNGCVVPKRLALYHWGELVTDMGPWISNVMHASLGVQVSTDVMGKFQDRPVCFERAVVNRRGLGGMSLENLNTMMDMARCRARTFCKVKDAGVGREGIRVTLLTRSGARAFSNESGVAAVIGMQCQKFSGCELQVVPVSNLSFCEQVQVMSNTDVFITSHGAQLTNMMFMSRGGSVMEMLPKGWLEFAGIGQYIYKWLADWSGLQHEGVWRDNEGPDCPYPASQELKCFLFHKDAIVGLNETYLAAWVSKVLSNHGSRRPHRRRPTRTLPCSCSLADANAASVVA